MIKMLWGQCVPKVFFNFIKQPDNSEYLLSQNVSFKGVNAIVQDFASQVNYWPGLKNCFAVYYSTYQYVYSMLFPKCYTMNNKFGMKNRIKFALCYERWRAVQQQQQIAKNPFNFNVENRPDNFQVVERHEYEHKPIEIDNDVEFRADVPDTRKKTPAEKKPDAVDGKENVPPPPPLPITYTYAPTMCSMPDFDQKYSLSKITKKPKVNEKKLAAREQKKKMLIEQLNKNTEKKRQIKKM